MRLRAAAGITWRHVLYERRVGYGWLLLIRLPGILRTDGCAGRSRREVRFMEALMFKRYQCKSGCRAMGSFIRLPFVPRPAHARVWARRPGQASGGDRSAHYRLRQLCPRMPCAGAGSAQHVVGGSCACAHATRWPAQRNHHALVAVASARARAGQRGDHFARRRVMDRLARKWRATNRCWTDKPHYLPITVFDLNWRS